MIWCRVVRKQVLSPEDRSTWPAWVARHVDACEDCRRFVARAARIRTALMTESPPAVDEAAIRLIMRRVRQLSVEETPRQAAEVWSGWRPIWGMRLAVAAALLILLGVRVSQRSQTESASETLIVETAPAPPMPMPAARIVIAPEVGVPPMRPLLTTPPYVVRMMPPVDRGYSGFVVATSNGGSGVEFGGLPTMPVSFDY